MSLTYKITSQTGIKKRGNQHSDSLHPSDSNPDIEIIACRKKLGWGLRDHHLLMRKMKIHKTDIKKVKQTITF